MSGFDELVSVLRHLRKECPWDREQTPRSLTRYILEESYELVDAIEHDGPERDRQEKIREELGDFAMQFILQSIIAEESGAFTLDQVCALAAKKLIARHPHVYGDVVAKDAAAVETGWEARKTAARTAAGESLFAHVPRALPALTRAEKLGKKAAEVGFDWPDSSGVKAKIREELDELESAPKESQAEEFGDLLFALVNLARVMKIDPEAALQAANGKFIRRFHAVEAGLQAQGKKTTEATLDEMEVHWQAAKAAERQG